ncbi:MAG: tungstate ABC transporter substrate-binding protein WtpA [Methanosarcinales archaeon]|nr:MAG: tungstate ABC transporter substrate-binding protein WtpA [Methanosarcinales archaeon]
MRTIYMVTFSSLLIIVVIIFGTVLTGEQKKTELDVIYAGSLIVPFGEIEHQFESRHPDVDVRIEGHGSIQAIRHITDIHEEYDVLAVADENLIPDLMYATGNNTESYCCWYVRFARNQMVIAYTNESRYANEINESNWYEILARPDVKFGFSNPMLDACGYRTLMTAQLAELYYNDQTIFDRLISCNFNPEIPVTENNGTYIVLIPEIFKPQSKKIIIRGGSVQLLALLDFNEIDYIFGYKSVAQQHGLRFLELPNEIDLSSSEYEDTYKKVMVRLGFQRFTSVGTDRVGKPIFYAITIPENAPHPELAAQFVQFVISGEGQRVLNDIKQPTVMPVADNLDRVPDKLDDVIEGRKP